MRLLQANGRKNHRSSNKSKKFRHNLSCRTLNPLDIIALNPGSEKPPGKIVGKLTRRIMLRHQLPEPGKVFPVQSLQILAVNIFAVLSQMGACPDIFY
jgi:hypothetical protein